MKKSNSTQLSTKIVPRTDLDLKQSGNEVSFKFQDQKSAEYIRTREYTWLPLSGFNIPVLKMVGYNIPEKLGLEACRLVRQRSIESNRQLAIQIFTKHLTAGKKSILVRCNSNGCNKWFAISGENLRARIGFRCRQHNRELPAEAIGQRSRLSSVDIKSIEKKFKITVLEYRPGQKSKLVSNVCLSKIEISSDDARISPDCVKAHVINCKLSAHTTIPRCALCMPKYAWQVFESYIQEDLGGKKLRVEGREFDCVTPTHLLELKSSPEELYILGGRAEKRRKAIRSQIRISKKLNKQYAILVNRSQELIDTLPIPRAIKRHVYGRNSWLRIVDVSSHCMRNCKNLELNPNTVPLSRQMSLSDKLVFDTCLKMFKRAHRDGLPAPSLSSLVEKCSSSDVGPMSFKRILRVLSHQKIEPLKYSECLKLMGFGNLRVQNPADAASCHKRMYFHGRYITLRELESLVYFPGMTSNRIRHLQTKARKAGKKSFTLTFPEFKKGKFNPFPLRVRGMIVQIFKKSGKRDMEIFLGDQWWPSLKAAAADLGMDEVNLMGWTRRNGSLFQIPNGNRLLSQLRNPIKEKYRGKKVKFT